MTYLNPDVPEGVRLQKVLARAGLGSRRKAEELINQGRVSVNGELVVGQGRRVNPDVDVVRVDGKRIEAAPELAAFMLNKPIGVITAMSDDRGRDCVGDIVASSGLADQGLFHVGRLDRDTTGLLLLINNGDVANKLAHPSHGVDKTYVATVEGRLSPNIVRRVARGVSIDGRKVEASHVRLVGTSAHQSVVELTIHEGRKHIVRRVLDTVGHPVVALTRTSFGPLRLGRLAQNDIRALSPAEAAAILDTADRL